MPRRRTSYSASRSRRTSRQVNERMVGTHVARSGQAGSSRPARRGATTRYAAAVVRRARIRRAVVGIVAVAVVVGLAVGAGLLAFRGTLGGALALRDSDAPGALVAARAGEPSYVLLTAELGAVAAPLDNDAPDVILLARLDPASRSLALVAVPPALQITTDNRSESVADIARSGDAALVSAIATFAKVDIAHFAKVGEGGVAGIVDALGGIRVDVDQVIDDPHAGTHYLAAGEQELDGQAALTYLRADNLAFGAEDQLEHQLRFAALVVERLFSDEGNFDARLEAVAPFLQTDYSLSDIEGIHSWLGGVRAGDVTCAVVPGYFAAVTNVTGGAGERYVGSASEMATLIDDLDEGRAPSVGAFGELELVSPSSFVVDVQNGTSVEGAAASMAGVLKGAGFVVGDVGNAEQPVFEETLVVYRDERGLACANTVIDALGVGRAVDSSMYYPFEHDVLLIVGADNKPVS